MAGPNDVILNVGAQLGSDVESKLQQSFSRIEKNIRFTPLAGASRNVRDFSSELDRANQRVITLGASFAVLSTTIRVFKDIISSTVAVEKALTDINSVFQLSTKGLGEFSRGLFNVYRETAQSFEKTAEAAKEFSRQGLSAEETLKRTRDAMVLTRLASLNTEEAVSTLTASINGFQKAALDSTQIVNKLATVDAQFAVSSKDLAQGLARAGAAASDAGVSFDELIGLITAAQQTTARGGTVIGNSLKTIFTRVERKDTIEAFEALGVAVTDLQGNVLPAIGLLKNFADTYDKLGGTIKKQAAELVGGVYQINILKALLSDLEKGSNSVAERAAKTSANAADEAIKRNEALNKSLAALLQQTQTTYQQIGSKVGDLGIGSAAKNVLGSLNSNAIVQAFANAGDADTNSLGEKAAAGFIKGFGNALVFGLGPSLLVVLGQITRSVFGKVQRDFADLVGANKIAKDQAIIQEQINALYNAGDDALKRQLLTMGSLAERAAFIESVLSRGAARQAAASSEIASLAGAVVGIRKTPRAADGYDPFSAEAAAIRAGVGGASPNAKPVLIKNFAYGGGVTGPIVANTSEYMVKTPNGSAIYNPAMINRMGLPPGATPIAAGGYLPGEGSSRQVQNIIDAYRSSFSKDDPIRFNQAEKASTYYPSVNQELRELSLKSGKTIEQLSYGLAALSANAPDYAARQSLQSLAMGGGTIGAIPQSNALKALKIFGASSREEMMGLLGGGAKTQNFAASLLLEKTFSGFGQFKSRVGVPAVMDSWAIYVRNGGAAAEKYNRDAVSEEQKRLLFKQSKRGYNYYNKLSSEYEEAARILGVDLSDLQARTWGYARGQPGSPTRMSAAGGYNPLSMEAKAIQSGVGGADKNSMPVYLPNFARGGGQMGIVANTSEFIVPTPGGKAIFTKEMANRFGLPPGSTPVAAMGYIPNMAEGGYASSDYYKNLGFGGSASGFPFGVVPGSAGQSTNPVTGTASGQGFGQFLKYAAASTSSGYDEAMKAKRAASLTVDQMIVDFEKAQKERAKQIALEAKMTELKQKQLEEMAKQLDNQKKVTGLSAADIKAIEKGNEKLRKAELERYEAAGAEVIRAKQAMEAKFPTYTASPETMSAFLAARAASAGSGSSYNAWITSRANAANPPPPPPKYVQPFLERTFPESYFKRDFQNLTLKDLSYSSSLPMPWVNGPSTDRLKESQIARGFAMRNVVTGSGVNYLQLNNALRASRGLASGSTIEEQFNATVQELLKSGKGMNTAYNAAIAEIMKETTNRAQINKIIRESIPVNVAFEKAMAENLDMISAKNKQNRVAINMQATQNQIRSVLEQGGFGALDPRQRAIYMATIRREEAQRLGFQNANVGGNVLAQSQINEAVSKRISQIFQTIPDSISNPQPKGSWFSSIKQTFKNNPLAGQLALSMGLPFVGGMIPEGRGGTSSGMALGGISSALTGAGTGAAIGSFIPGIGTAFGAGIGAAIGGLTGALGKMTGSFEELAQQINDANAKIKVQFDNASEVARLQQDIANVLSSDQSDEQIQKSVRTLRSKMAVSLSRIEKPEIRKMLESGDENSIRDALETITSGSEKRTQGNDLISAVKGALDTSSFGGAFGYDKGASSRIANALAPILSNKDIGSRQLATISREAQKDPQGTLKKLLVDAGVDEETIARMIPNLRLNLGVFDGYDETRDLFREGISKAISSVTGDRLRQPEVINRQNTRAKKLSSLAALTESYKGQAEFTQIRLAADQQIRAVQQQIALASPNLLDTEKLRNQGLYAAENIRSQFAGQRATELLSGKSALTAILGKGGDSDSIRKLIDGLSSLEDVTALLQKMNTPEGILGAGASSTPEFKKTLLDLQRSMQKLNETESQQIRVNSETNKLMLEQLNFTKTYAGARAEYGGAARTAGANLLASLNRFDTPDILLKNIGETNLASLNDQYNRSKGKMNRYEYQGRRMGISANTNAMEKFAGGAAIRYLLNNPSVMGAKDLTGSQVTSGLLSEAEQTGLSGKSLKSFQDGFKAVFAGMRKDMSDMSKMGANLGQSLSNSLSNAFGDFVTGAKSGKDAFRSFAISVLNDASRMFASQAIQGILGSLFGSISPTIGSGKSMGFAAGGKVPAMLTGGEYYIGPNAAKKIGYDTLHRLNGYADGGIVRGGSGVKDDVPAKLAPGSFIIKKSAVNKLGSDYLDSLVGGKVQHRFFGGFLLGSLLGGGIGALTGGKKGAIAGALLGGIGGGLTQNYMNSGSIFSSSAPMNAAGATMEVGYGEYGAGPAAGATKAPMSLGTKLALGLGAAALLGGASRLLSPKEDKFTPMTAAQIHANRLSLEANQPQTPAGLYPWLSRNPNGGSNLAGYVPPTRLFADGGMVDGASGGGVDMGMMPSNSTSRGGSSSSVNVKIEINNNGQTSATASSSGKDGQNGFGPEFAQKLQKQVQAMIQQELVTQSRSDGFFSQRSRYVQR